MNSRPPREQDAGQGQTRKQIGAAIADMPERFIPRYFRSPGGEENRSGKNGDAVGSRVPGLDVFLRPDLKRMSLRPS